jgi:hypothetical protein
MTKNRNFEPLFNGVLGVKQGIALTNMPTGSLIDAQNMYLDNMGGKYMRAGYQLLFTLPVTEEVRSLHEYRTTAGVQRIMAYADTVIYQMTGGVVSSINTDWQFVNYVDRCLGVNGADSFDYDGTNYRKIGMSAPTAHIGTAVAAEPTSTLDGTYSYYITFYDSNRTAESEPYSFGTASTADAGNPAVLANKITLGNFPAYASGEFATHYRVYRRWHADHLAAPQEAIWTRTKELVYATYVGTTYIDKGDATGTISLDYDTGAADVGNTPPPNSKLILIAFDRVLMVSESDPTMLIYSRAGRTHSFPSANYQYVGRKDGYRIDKIELNGKSVVIHKKNSIYYLDGDPKTTTAVRLNGRGTAGRYSSCADIDGLVYRLSQDGFYCLSPTDYSTVDLRDEYIGGDIATEESAIVWTAMTYVRMIGYVRQSQTFVYAIFPNTSDLSSNLLAYDVTTKQWTPHYVGTDIYSITTQQNATSAQKELIFGDGYGKVWRWDLGYADGSSGGTDDLNGISTGTAATTLTDSTKSALWTTNALVGCVVTILTGTGANQRKRISANTTTQITVVGGWTTTPSVGCEYSIGAIDHWADEFWNSHGPTQNKWKRMRWVIPYIRQIGDYDIDVSWRRDFQSGFDHAQTISLSASSSLWGTMIWGTALWGSSTSNLRRLRFSGKYHYYSIRYRSQRAAEPIYWDGHGATFQVLNDRNK